MTEKRPIGRPTLYDPAYCEQIVEHMKGGASILSFAASIGVARATVTLWADEHPEFLAAVTRAKAACAAWWEEQARKVAANGGGNGQSTMIVFGLKNMGRDEWSDTTRITGGDPAAGDKPVQVNVTGLSESALAEIASLSVEGE